eukprot:m.16703 g.16703  ORF g.16703 m.16703 type:complete len:98 (-) comp5082_c0_seq1:689-982(-)
MSVDRNVPCHTPPKATRWLSSIVNTVFSAAPSANEHLALPPRRLSGAKGPPFDSTILHPQLRATNSDIGFSIITPSMLKQRDAKSTVDSSSPFYCVS